MFFSILGNSGWQEGADERESRTKDESTAPSDPAAAPINHAATPSDPAAAPMNHAAAPRHTAAASFDAYVGAALSSNDDAPRTLDEDEPAVYLVNAIREKPTLNFFILCATYFG